MQTISFPLKVSPIAIILNGQREAMDCLRSRWQDYRTIIVCDGGWETVEKELLPFFTSQKGLSPQLIAIGDGDSITHKPPYFIQDDDQYSTDFEKALKYVLSRKDLEHRDIDIYWANGGDLDHTMGNMAMACKYNQQFTCHFYTDSQYYRYVNSDFTTLNAKGKTFSLFPFPQCMVKHSTGILYPMINYSMTQHTQQSLRNEISEDIAVVELGVKVDYFTDEEMGCFLFLEL